MSFFSRLRGSRSSPAPSATGGPDASAAADAARPDDGARVRTVRALVSGQVQGVGFRWYCTEEAQSLGLVGRVSNLPDGDVKVLVQGPADAVSQLVAWLYCGPRWARVDDVRLTELPPGSLSASSFQPGN
ncbi:acylphosphatase [Actinomyces israelii]